MNPLSIFSGIPQSILGQATNRSRGPTIIAAPKINASLLRTRSYAKPVATASSPASGGGSYSSGGGGGYNQQAVSQYDQSIQNTQAAIDRLNPQLQSGLSAIGSNFSNALNQLLLSRNQGQKTYDTNKSQTAKDYVSAKNTIGSNAGNTLSGLLRLLGSHGAGGGSAYRISAPQAVAREATIQRTGASDTFGANQQSLDTAWNNFLTGYQNEVSSAKNQRANQERELKQSISENRAKLLGTLADLQSRRAQVAGGNGVKAAQPYLDQANSILDKISSYKVKPIDYKTMAYDAPDLASYTSSAISPTYQGNPVANDYFSPYLSALLGDKRRQTVGA